MSHDALPFRRRAATYTRTQRRGSVAVPRSRPAMKPSTLALLRALVAFAVAFLACAGDARAEGRRGGALVVSSGRRVIALEARGAGAFEGAIELGNDGDAPLVVSRAALRAEGVDPRVLAAVSVVADPTGFPLTLAPGERRTVRVTLEDDPVLFASRQLLAHVVIASSDEGRPELAVGVRADLPRRLAPLLRVAPSLLVVLPLLAALVISVVRRRAARVLAPLLAAGAGAVVAIAAFATVDADTAALPQLAARATWLAPLGAEYFVGVDGVSAAALAALFLALLVVHVGADRGVSERAPVATLVLASGCAGALVAEDLLLLALFVSVMAGVLVAMIQALLGARTRRRATVAVLVSFAAIHASLVVLVHRADPCLLGDGTRAALCFALPELGRVAPSTAPIAFGVSRAHLAVVLALAGAAPLLGLFPLHGAWRHVLAHHDDASVRFAFAAVPSVLLATLLRVVLVAAPEAFAWSAGVVAALGLLTLGASAASLVRRRARSIADLSLAVSATLVGVAALGAGSVTAIGVTGAVVLIAGRVVALTLLAAGLAPLHRAGIDELVDLRGIATVLPRAALQLTLALVGATLLPPAVAGWGVMSALLGAAAAEPWFALAALVLSVPLVATLVRTAASLRDRAATTPEFLAGADVTRAELVAFALALAAAVAAGVWPSLAMAHAAAWVREIAILHVAP